MLRNILFPFILTCIQRFRFDFLLSCQMPSCIVVAVSLDHVCPLGIVFSPVFLSTAGNLGCLIFMDCDLCAIAKLVLVTLMEHLISAKTMYVCCCLQFRSLQGDFQRVGGWGGKGLCLFALVFVLS